MTKKLVRNHSHWGAFLAEVEDGRFVGVRPFERDPDPSPIIAAMPDAVYSKTRVAQPPRVTCMFFGLQPPNITISWE